MGIFNVVWFVFVGWWSALITMILSGVMAMTIIGILFPLGAFVTSYFVRPIPDASNPNITRAKVIGVNPSSNKAKSSISHGVLVAFLTKVKFVASAWEAAEVLFAPLVAPVRLPAPDAVDLPVYVISSVSNLIVPWVGKLSVAATGIVVVDESIPLVDLGQMIYKKNACYTCHSTDGSKIIGPSFKGIWETEMKHADGTTAIVDENYILESLIEPQKKIVNGYQGVMPSYKGILRDREIQGVIEYIKSFPAPALM